MSTAANENPGCLTRILRFFYLGMPEEQDDFNILEEQDDLSVLEEQDDSDALPYRVRDDFLSPAELSFYFALCAIVGEQAVVCPKVGVADILFPVVRGSEYMSFHNRIAMKHIDFLLCDPKSLKPYLGIELDDASHRRPDRKMRDEFVDGAFEAASLPILHVAVQRGYDRQELAAKIAPFLDDTANSATKPTVWDGSATASVPICPKCGVPMVLRTAKRGKQQGQQFYGCPNYPRCREMQRIP